MNKPPMHEVYNTIVNLLANAISNDLMFDVKDRYHSMSSEQAKIEERHGYKKAAEKSWLAAKHLYCLYQEDLDSFYEAHKPMLDRKNCETYDAMRQVIQEEMNQQVENLLGEISDTRLEDEQEKQ